MANASRKDILSKVYKMVPPMLESFHKGKSQPPQASNPRANRSDHKIQANWVA